MENHDLKLNQKVLKILFINKIKKYHYNWDKIVRLYLFTIKLFKILFKILHKIKYNLKYENAFLFC